MGWMTIPSCNINPLLTLLQVVFHIEPALESVSAAGRKVQELRDVRIPSTETFICPFAFRGCRYLLRLVIPESVTEIGEDAPL